MQLKRFASKPKMIWTTHIYTYFSKLLSNLPFFSARLCGNFQYLMKHWVLQHCNFIASGIILKFSRWFPTDLSNYPFFRSSFFIMNFLLWIFNDLLVKKNQNAQKLKKTKAHNGPIITKVVSTCLIALYPSSPNENTSLIEVQKVRLRQSSTIF